MVVWCLPQLEEIITSSNPTRCVDVRFLCVLMFGRDLWTGPLPVHRALPDGDKQYCGIPEGERLGLIFLQGFLLPSFISLSLVWSF